MRLEQFQARREAGASFQHLSGAGSLSGAERIEETNLQTVEAKFLGKIIKHGFMGDGRLRHTESAEGTAGGAVGQHCAAGSFDMRHMIGAHGMHRDTPGNGRPPRGIAAGVHVGMKFDRQQTALGVATEARRHESRVPLGRAHHAFRAAVDGGDRTLRQPGCNGDQRLHRKIELAAKAAAAGCRDDADIFLGQFEDVCHFVTVHDWRLGRDVDFYSIPDATRPARLGLDIGMLDISGFKLAFGDGGTCLKRRGDIALFYPTLGEDIARPIVMQLKGARRHC